MGMIVACSTTSHLPEGETLYTGVKKMKVYDQKGTMAEDLAVTEVKAALAYKPNGSLLGSSSKRSPLQVGLWIYNALVDKPRTGFNKWMFNSFAGTPVTISSVSPETRTKVATNILQNYGYFRGDVDYSLIDQRKPRTQRIAYDIHLGEPYLYDSIRYAFRDSIQDSILRATEKEAYLHQGDQFSTLNLTNEKDRIVSAFRNNGLYYYRPDYPTGLFDTIICNYVLNVLEPYAQAEVMMNVSNLIKPTGTAYFAVRRDIEEEGFRLHAIHKQYTYQCNVKLPYKSLVSNSSYELYQYNHFNKLPRTEGETCPFCRLARRVEIICETATCVAFYDGYPVSPGHALIVPKRHVASYFDLTHHEREAMNVMLQYVRQKVDERFHTEKATLAACKYLKQAYAKYHDWMTVAASYNAGQGGISKRLTDQHQDSAMDLWLVEETSRYMFRILAAKIYFENPSEFGFTFSREDLYPYIPPREEVEVSGPINDLVEFAEKYGVSYFDLKQANLWLRDTKLVNKDRRTYFIAIPDVESEKYDPSRTRVHSMAWVRFSPMLP